MIIVFIIVYSLPFIIVINIVIVNLIVIINLIVIFRLATRIPDFKKCLIGRREETMAAALAVSL